jgi:hypothetical protein
LLLNLSWLVEKQQITILVFATYFIVVSREATNNDFSFCYLNFRG